MSFIVAPVRPRVSPDLFDFQAQEPEKVFELVYGDARPGGYIAIGSRRPGRGKPEPFPHYLTVLPVKEHQQFLPGILSCRPDETKYICPNTFDRSALRHSPDNYIRTLEDEKPRFFEARNPHVRELSAVVIDLDIYKMAEPLDPREALLVVLGRALFGQVPLPTLLAMSGRGVYVWYLLRDETSNHPPLVDETSKHLWWLALNELLNRTVDLNSDQNAKRPAQWFKCPGTIDTTSGNEIVYLTPGIGTPQNLPVYTLPDLISQLKITSVDATAQLAHSTSFPRREPRPKTARSGVAANPYWSRCRDIELLAVHRNGIVEGYRHTTLLHYF